VIVAAASFFPFAEILWGLRSAPLRDRILLALDHVLPYAFVGMLFGELWAATAGLGFFVVVARAMHNRTEALATSLIALGLMTLISSVLKLAIKWFVTSEPHDAPLAADKTH
jgi:ABC-type nitrate/sulfonate/bicarbonate transport system permease component